MHSAIGAITRPLVLAGAGALAGASVLALGPVAIAQAKAWPLKSGSKGGRVTIVQRDLHQHADGRYGRGTAAAVRRFQHRHKLTADGKVGPATWSALVRATRGSHHARHHTRTHRSHHSPHRVRLHRIRYTRARHAHHSHRASAHARGAAVRLLQRRLGLHADGVFGSSTRRAVIRLQHRHGLHGDGVVGPDTWRALRIRGRHAVLKAKRAHHARAHRARRRRHGARASLARAIAGANRIAHLPYRFGGGHGSFHDSAYDCSGSVSYVLHAAHVLAAPLDSSQLMSYGRPGHGRWITVYANSGHAFMVIDGRRFDTGDGHDGSRWQTRGRSASGYVVRHPPGL